MGWRYRIHFRRLHEWDLYSGGGLMEIYLVEDTEYTSGGYMSGTSTLEVYDASILAATANLIVTSMQYR